MNNISLFIKLIKNSLIMLKLINIINKRINKQPKIPSYKSNIIILKMHFQLILFQKFLYKNKEFVKELKPQLKRKNM